MSEHRMILHLWPGAIGHLAIQVLGPKGTDVVMGRLPARHEDRLDVDGRRTMPSRSVELTERQYDGLRDYWRTHAEWGRQETWARDSVTYVMEALAAAGLPAGKAATLFSLEQLRWAGRAGALLSEWGGGEKGITPPCPGYSIADLSRWGISETVYARFGTSNGAPEVSAHCADGRLLETFRSLGELRLAIDDDLVSLALVN